MELEELAQAQLSELGIFERGILDVEFREPFEPEVHSDVATTSLVNEGQLCSRQGFLSGCTAISSF